ncbi:MAG: hypothetical protein AAB367_04455 [Patescibacteria group bacterium]
MTYWQRLARSTSAFGLLWLFVFLSDVLGQVKSFVPQKAYVPQEALLKNIQETWFAGLVGTFLTIILFSLFIRSEKIYTAQSTGSIIGFLFATVLVISWKLFS